MALEYMYIMNHHHFLDQLINGYKMFITKKCQNILRIFDNIK